MGSVLIIAGYGGHSGYAFAVVHELSRMGFGDNVILIAEGHGHLAEKFRKYGEVKFVTLPRRPGEPLARTAHRWIKAFWQSARIALGRNISAAFASGSNFSIPPSLAAKALRGSEVLTLEAIEHLHTPSRAVKALEKIGAMVFLHWEEQKALFPGGEVVGPIYEPPLYEPRDEGYILATTGTLGHPELLRALEALGIEKVVAQTGDVDPEPFISRNPSWRAFRYTSDIHKWIAGASIVITQQGLTASISALAYRKPTIIVWNPRVQLGATKEETVAYAEKIGASFLESPEPSALRSLIEGARVPASVYPNGAEAIARRILELVRG